jgi:UDP-galactopyranose mutase
MVKITQRSYSRIECPVVIVGAGLCGLSAAYHLEQAGYTDYLILERNHEVGGLARTETYDGFSFDHSIHILYTRDSYVADLICNKLLIGNLRKQERESYCYTAGIYTEYPYQAHNYGLPVEIIVENILGLIKAHYELSHNDPPPHFEAWIYRTFGRGIAEHFMIPYNRRQWAWDLKDMSYDWIADRVLVPRIEEVLLGALRPPSKKYGPNQEFWYPMEGGIEALPKAFLQYIPEERIWLNTTVIGIDGSRREVILADGRRLRYKWLISTIPLPILVSMLGESVPSEVKAAAAGLKYNIVHTVNIGLEGTNLGIDKPMHWVYFADDKTVFHRISFPHHFSEWMVPPGCCSIQAEISESVYQPRNQGTLIQETLEGLVRVGILSEEEVRPVTGGGRIRVVKMVTLNPAYIIYDLKHCENVQVIKEYLLSFNIETRGRFGEWEYFNMDHAILSGKKAVEEIVGSHVT